MIRSRYNKKKTVEACFALDLVKLLARGSIVAGESHRGTCRWARGGNPSGEIGYLADLTDPDHAELRLTYRHGEESVDYAVRIESTTPNYGGSRWWFRCPLIIGGVACRRRCRVLYLRGRYFGCRTCHDLSYRSTQQWNQRVADLARNPAAIAAMLDGNPGVREILLAIKARGKLLEQVRDFLDQGS